MKIRLTISVKVLFVCWVLGGPAAAERFERSVATMGTIGNCIVYADSESAVESAWQKVQERWSEVDAVFSDYRHDSEIAQLRRRLSAGTAEGEVRLSPRLSHVLLAAIDLSRRSDGVFDVTCGPLTRLYREARRRHEFPSEGEIREAHAAVGWQSLAVRTDPHSATTWLQCQKPGMAFDFGAIAKGYAVDLAVKEFTAVGCSAVLVDLGGDLAVTGPPPSRGGWRVAVAPLGVQSTPVGYLELSHQAIATSGDAEQYWDTPRGRLSHIIDPRTGWPIRNAWSVSVIGDSAMLADAYATLLSVLGPTKGFAWLARHAPTASACMYRGSDPQAEFRYSKNFPRLLNPQPLLNVP